MHHRETNSPGCGCFFIRQPIHPASVRSSLRARIRDLRQGVPQFQRRAEQHPRCDRSRNIELHLNERGSRHSVRPRLEVRRDQQPSRPHKSTIRRRTEQNISPEKPNNKGEHYDDETLMYFWRNPDDGLACSRPYYAAELAGLQTRALLGQLAEGAKEAIILSDQWDRPERRLSPRRGAAAGQAPGTDPIPRHSGQLPGRHRQTCHQVLVELTGVEV